jgi:hypothetical protein
MVAEPGGVQGQDIGLEPGRDLLSHGAVIPRQDSLIQNMFDPDDQLGVKVVEDPRRAAGPVLDRHGMTSYPVRSQLRSGDRDPHHNRRV